MQRIVQAVVRRYGWVVLGVVLSGLSLGSALAWSGDPMCQYEVVSAVPRCGFCKHMNPKGACTDWMVEDLFCETVCKPGTCEKTTKITRQCGCMAKTPQGLGGTITKNECMEGCIEQKDVEWDRRKKEE